MQTDGSACPCRVEVGGVLDLGVTLSQLLPIPFMRCLSLCGIFLVALMSSGYVLGQEALVSPAPFPLTAADRVATPASVLLPRLAASRALELGFPSIAAGILRAELVGLPAEATAERNRLLVDLGTALLDDSRPTEAEEALGLFVGLPSPALRLRQALVAVRLKKMAAARTEVAAIRPDELTPGDRGWFYFVQGQLAEAAGDLSKSSAFYEQAIQSATNELQSARFQLARDENRLVQGEFSEEQVSRLRPIIERNPGGVTGYKAISQLVATLNGLGRRTEAVETLRRQLQELPKEQKQVADEWHLLLGLIAGANDAVGRNALMQILDKSSDREKQRVALLLLSRVANPTGFKSELNRWIDSPSAHPILEDLLIQRAEFNLLSKAYVEAENDVDRMLGLFPGSRLKPQALGVRVRAAWEALRYRRAADYATQARTALGPEGGQVGAELGVVVAEAYFRAGDFRLAADAYAAALNQIPAGIVPGDLIFQRILSEIESAQADPARLAVAAALVDQSARDPRFDISNRWQSEWNLARALQVAGGPSIRAAFDRIERLLEPMQGGQGSVVSLPDDLRVRMAWLRAKLSLDVGMPEKTLALVDVMLATLASAKLESGSEILSSARLLQADAFFALPGREVEGLEILRRLRTDYPQSDAAVKSIMKEARFAANQNRFVEAQSLLVKLADDYGKHAYAPFALYEAALNAEKRGQATFYRDANRLIERLIREYPKSDLVFYARLKQGDLLRKLDEFPLAQQVYEELVNSFSKHPDVLFAHLARAACHAAQAGSDQASAGQISGHAELALGIYERLVDQADAPADIRIEAGFNLGLLLSRRGKLEGKKRAETVWWQQVLTPFLLNAPPDRELTTTGRYWISRVVLALGELLEQQGRLEQARDAYLLILDRGLPGSALAKGQLARLGVQR